MEVFFNGLKIVFTRNEMMKACEMKNNTQIYQWMKYARNQQVVKEKGVTMSMSHKGMFMITPV